VVATVVGGAVVVVAIVVGAAVVVAMVVGATVVVIGRTAVDSGARVVGGASVVTAVACSGRSGSAMALLTTPRVITATPAAEPTWTQRGQWRKVEMARLARPEERGETGGRDGARVLGSGGGNEDMADVPLPLSWVCRFPPAAPVETDGTCAAAAWSAGWW
jgi:hypothetical protein